MIKLRDIIKMPHVDANDYEVRLVTSDGDSFVPEEEDNYLDCQVVDMQLEICYPPYMKIFIKDDKK